MQVDQNRRYSIQLSDDGIEIIEEIATEIGVNEDGSVFVNHDSDYQLGGRRTGISYERGCEALHQGSGEI